MAIEVFNRYEYKYILSSQESKEIINELTNILELDEFCKENYNYKIINSYVDTVNYQMIRDSLDKPVYKQKLRIRSYEQVTGPDDFVFFEIKKKYKGIVNKRRCKLKYKEALQMIYQKEIPKKKDYMNEQILKEIYYILTKDRDKYELKSQIIYDRVAFFSQDKKLRISFDFNIHSKTLKHLNCGEVLMEIKTPDSIPMWLVELLNKKEIRSQSFSKYGLDFKDKMKRGVL